jgi:hypothetical protein
LVVVGLALSPLAARADDTESIVGEGFSGLGTGAGVGLATGFLASGPKFESGEWKKLVFGTAIGALTGLGIGIVMGIVDASVYPDRLGVGHYILRDMNLGLGVGVVAGGIVGALVWLDDGRAKDLLLGMAYGALIGVGAGLILGIIEGSLRVSDGSGHREAVRNRRLRFDIGMMPPARGELPMPYPSISGTF